MSLVYLISKFVELPSELHNKFIYRERKFSSVIKSNVRAKSYIKQLTDFCPTVRNSSTIQILTFCSRRSFVLRPLTSDGIAVQCSALAWRDVA